MTLIPAYGLTHRCDDRLRGLVYYGWILKVYLDKNAPKKRRNDSVSITQRCILLLGNAIPSKDAGAIYQRAMVIIFKEILGDTIECYVDDMVLNHDRGRSIGTSRGGIRQTSSASTKDEFVEMHVQRHLDKFLTI